MSIEGPNGALPHWLLERFDHDGDGRLDDAERAEAERFLEQRRRERELRRAEMMRRFDVDGDGRLNAEEREAMRRWLQEPRDANGASSGDDNGST
jgi:Ca2+-binding EF-hand superfamily protein